MKSEVISVKASELLNDGENGKVTVRLNELRAKAEKESLWTVDKLIKVHSDIIEIGLALKSGTRTVIEGVGKGFTQAVEVDTKDLDLSAVKASAVEIGKLQGFYTAKVEVSGELNMADFAKAHHDKKNNND